jgi:hypothetical protein
MKDLRQTLEQIWQAYSGGAAWQTVADLSRLHRIQASPGYRQAAHLVYHRLSRAGLEAEVLAYPANYAAQFWAWTSFPEWECTAATLELVTPEAEPRSLRPELANFRACPISVIQRSAPFEGEADLVLLEDGAEEADYEGLDVTGKVVLTCGDLRRVWELAVKERGAVGILFDGMRPVPQVRPEGDLVDVRQYTSFWWLPGDEPCFGFVLTPRQGRTLRRQLRDGKEPVRVRAHVDARLCDGSLEVVSATIPGQTDQEIVVVAHLCHPQPSANDNASGAACALEAAVTLHDLIASQQLAPPQRTIRFLWLPEMTGSLAYLSDHESRLDRMVAGLNLDMVGQDQDQTGSSWLIERPPDASASFAPVLLACLRDEMPHLKAMTDVSPGHTGLDVYPLYRLAEVPFSGGSDHYVFSDPTVGVPMPMLIQWPDRFYHTSADTPERTDPQSLARAGTLAAAYAYWLATAGAAEATWLGYEMLARFKTRVVTGAQAAVTRSQDREEASDLAKAIINLDRRLAYLLDREQAAFQTLQRLAPVGCLVTDLQAEAEGVVHRELAWARGGLDLRAATLGYDQLPIIPARPRSEHERQAAKLVPDRQHAGRQARGPIPFQQHLSRLSAEDRQAWRQLMAERQNGAHRTTLVLALYWADGARSILEIADLVEMETGQRDVELLLTYFQLLDKLSLVALYEP